MAELCVVCGSAFAASKITGRCTTCQVLIEQAGNKGSARRAAIKSSVAEAALRESVALRRELYPETNTGYVCVYSQILLETEKSHHARGDYLSFDHVVPNNGARAAVSSRIANDLKGWMTDKEFRLFITSCLDTTLPRRLHGLDETASGEFLSLLRLVMLAEDNQDSSEVRTRLKRSSAQFRYSIS